MRHTVVVLFILTLITVAVALSGCTDEAGSEGDGGVSSSTMNATVTGEGSDGGSTGGTFELTEQVPSDISGGTEETTPSASNVTVAACLYFGDVVLFDKPFSLSGSTTAMDALKSVSSVETSYGGGFVESINGHRSLFRSGENVDWFYTINGFSAEVGAEQYILHPGDIEIWDYHAWDTYGKTAIIGAWPEPLIHGYRGVVRDTIIVYQSGVKDEAEKLASFLENRGVTVKVTTWGEVSEEEKESYNLILLGDSSFTPIDDIFSIADRLNLYTYIHDGEIKVSSADSPTQEGCVVIATNSIYNPKGTAVNENIIFIVAGTDISKVKDGVNALLNPDSIRYRYAAIVDGNNVIPVPSPSEQ